MDIVVRPKNLFRGGGWSKNYEEQQIHWILFWREFMKEGWSGTLKFWEASVLYQWDRENAYVWDGGGAVWKSWISKCPVDITIDIENVVRTCPTQYAYLPVCILLCAVRFELWRKVRPHHSNSHLNILSPSVTKTRVDTMISVDPKTARALMI